jgi:hypothetical protein
MAYGKDAPFDRDDLAGWDMEKMLGWMVMNANFISTNARNGRTDCTPIIVKTCDGYYFQAGQKGDALVLGHALELARKLYDRLYPPVTNSKPLHDMSISELRDEAVKLWVCGVGVWETNDPGFFTYYAMCGESASLGSDRRCAMKAAICEDAKRVGRYDPNTDTIKEA